MKENAIERFLLTLTLILLTSLLPPLSAQQTLSDSLQALLPTLPADSQKVNTLNDLAWEYKIDQADKARQYLQQAANLARQINYPKGEAQAYNNWGVVETIQDNLELAQSYYEKALTLRRQLNDQKGVASLYNNIGNLKEAFGDKSGALESFRESLELRQALKDTIRTARVCYNIALVYESMGIYTEALEFVLKHLAISETLEDDFEIANAENLLGNIKIELEQFSEAMEHHQKALLLRQKLADEWELAVAYNNRGNSQDGLAEVQLKEKKYPSARRLFFKALEDYQQSLRLYQQLEDREGEGYAFNNIGLVYKNLGTYYIEIQQADSARQSLSTAMEWLDKSLNLRRIENDSFGIMEVFNGIGDVRRRQQRWHEALEYTQKYFAIALQLGDQKFIQKAYKDLSRAYEGLGQFQKAFRYRKSYDELRYQRLDEDRVKQNLRIEAIFGDIQKQHAIKEQEKELELQEAELEKAALQQKTLLGGAVGLLFLAMLLYNRYRLKNRANQALAQKNTIIKEEQQRSEELLLNILPAETAQELKEKGKAKARHYESVSVLFTDFKAFTSLAEQLSAEELVAELDECFRAFDTITASYGIEKIKTIGDAYMCASGLPKINTTHAVDLVNAALDIQEFMTRFQQKRLEQNRPVFEARIGIHTGPVVAGIVGSRKFAYDIWGDTVNIAARMESSGAIGKVNISQSTYDRIKDRFACVSRGKVAAKNKGEISMYFVERKKNQEREQREGSTIR